MILDPAGQLYIADTTNNRVRKVDAAGMISVVAGDGIAEFGLDGIKATKSHAVNPTGVTLDGHGHLVIAEQGFARVRQVDLATGIITTIAGTGIPGFTGDGLPATQAELNAPTKVAFDAAGNMYIADAGNFRVRRVEAGTTPPPKKGCGEVITKDTKLHADIGPCPLDGIVMGADNITLDLNGYQVLGVGHTGDAGDAPEAAGIRLANRKGVTITSTGTAGGPQGAVTGFQEGVAIIGGSGNTVRNVNVHDNIGPLTEAATFGDGIGIFFSSGNRIIGNQVVHNGIYDGIGLLGVGTDYNLIQNNTITSSYSGDGCCGGAGEGTAILLNPFLEAGLPRMVSIYGNQMIGNTVSNNDNSGITNISNRNGVIKNNVVENNDSVGGGPFGGALTSPGNGIGVSNLANAVGDTNMLVQGNQVHGNGSDGIVVASSGNRILNNNAVGNALFAYIGFYTFDLADEAGCQNVWNGNLWGDGVHGFESGCETAGGHPVPGPPSPPAAAASANAPAVKAPSVHAKPAPNNSWSNPAPRGHPANPAG